MIARRVKLVPVSVLIEMMPEFDVKVNGITCVITLIYTICVYFEERTEHSFF